MSRRDWKNIITVLVIIFVILGLLVLFGRGASAKDDGRYANSPLKPWFDKLSSGKGLCCSYADGEVVVDADWDSKDGHYRVRLEGQWVDVPDNAVITEPNLFGRTMVWPVKYGPPTRFEIRCFMPGSMT